MGEYTGHLREILQSRQATVPMSSTDQKHLRIRKNLQELLHVLDYERRSYGKLYHFILSMKYRLFAPPIWTESHAFITTPVPSSFIAPFITCTPFRNTFALFIRIISDFFSLSVHTCICSENYNIMILAFQHSWGHNTFKRRKYTVLK